MARFRHAFATIGRAVAIMVVAACVILVLWWVPKLQVASLWNAKDVNAKDVFKAENDARATLAQILGGFAILIGLYFAWRNIAATTKNLELANKNFELATKDLELTKEGQVTERFTKAIQQLGATDDKGKPKLELRLGGIYALERIARDSERDHWPIMEILTAYVREHAQWKEPNLPADKKLPPLGTDMAVAPPQERPGGVQPRDEVGVNHCSRLSVVFANCGAAEDGHEEVVARQQESDGAP
jgi:hypothetical protein